MAKKKARRRSTPLPFDPLAASYSSPNAYALAEMARLAYSKKADVKTQTKKWGFHHTEFIDRSDTQVFVTSNDAVIIVAFRGTDENVNDIITDANIFLTGGPLGKVHSGFAEALNFVWRDVTQAIKDDQDGSQTLWFTGHSLGAALASLGVARLIERGVPVDGLYTYGSPRCGDATFAQAFDSRFLRAFRHVYGNDIVPRVPPRAFGYHAIGSLKHISKQDCTVADGSGSSILRNVAVVLNVLGTESLRSFDGFEDHSVDNYIRCLKQHI